MRAEIENKCYFQAHIIGSYSSTWYVLYAFLFFFHGHESDLTSMPRRRCHCRWLFFFCCLSSAQRSCCFTGFTNSSSHRRIDCSFWNSNKCGSLPTREGLTGLSPQLWAEIYVGVLISKYTHVPYISVWFGTILYTVRGICYRDRRSVVVYVSIYRRSRHVPSTNLVCLKLQQSVLDQDKISEKRLPLPDVLCSDHLKTRRKHVCWFARYSYSTITVVVVVDPL